MRFLLLVPPFLAVLPQVSCEKEEDVSECTHDPELTYDNFGKPFLQAYCNGCHSSLVPDGLRNDAPVGIDFDTYESVLRWRTRIDIRTTVSEGGQSPEGTQIMPPGGGPTELEYELFHEWLACSVAEDAATVFGTEE